MPGDAAKVLGLNALSNLPSSVARPQYQPAQHKIGIVHLGLGAFHRAHQAAYTDTALGIVGGDWRIMGASMRSSAVAETLSEQDNLYTLLERGATGTKARVIGAIGQSLALSKSRRDIRAQICAAETKIITLTVTEKAYCYRADDDRLDLSHPDIRHDIASLPQAKSVPGFLVHALQQRLRSGAGGLTILSCDNLPNNGQATKRVVLDFASQIDADLSDWIEKQVSFPSSMVDRITPRQTPGDLAEAAALTGVFDAAPVQCEDFTQWVIEDDFPYGRPAWEKAGALFAQDVTPYEKMKLRMLNGSHSLLAYAGHVSGHKTIGGCLRSAPLRAVLERHLSCVPQGLQPLSGIDYGLYAQHLVQRFANPGIAHATYQIAMDGSQKMRQRIFEPAIEALAQGKDIGTYAFATAAWMRYLKGNTEDGQPYDLNDPYEPLIHNALDGLSDSTKIISSLRDIDNLLPPELFGELGWRTKICGFLDEIAELGVEAAAQNSLV